jgi:hypothetical protein
MADQLDETRPYRLTFRPFVKPITNPVDLAYLNDLLSKIVGAINRQSVAGLIEFPFVAYGGERFIELPYLVDLNKEMIVHFAAFGGSMAVLKAEIEYTVSNASGKTRVTILNTSVSPVVPYVLQKGDIGSIWSTRL